MTTKRQQTMHLLHALEAPCHKKWKLSAQAEVQQRQSLSLQSAIGRRG